MSLGFPELAAIRLGYGLSPLMPPPQDADAVLAGVARAAPGADAVTTDEAREFHLRLGELSKARKQGDKKAVDEYRTFARSLSRLTVIDLQRRMVRAVDDPVGFGERLVQFWSDHFTIRPMGAGQNPLAMAFADEAIRPHLTGRFEDMYVAAETHPMMMLYLDQTASRGPNSPFAQKRKERGFGLNENLAREALELHSMGVGAPYSQKDVRELAELLTGMTYTPAKGVVFQPQMAEPGAETVLGESYGGGRADMADIRAALTDIARRPETAQYVSKKLAVHFFSDTPPEPLVRDMVQTWRETGGDLARVYRVMVGHPALAQTMGQKIRQPFDLLAAGFRALGVTGQKIAALEHPQNARWLFNAMNSMGQPWGRQKGPDGWPEEASAWIAPQQLAARINWSLRMPRQMLDELPDPRELLETTFRGGQSPELAWAVPKAESRAEGVALILASSDFNRR
ncbi:Uncharacterized conserved protein, DUF1800 family [Paracoccus halophilus]|uniref:Uncharacterized conserved protein, DUF1800 family n=1 Tax=Paracoccus halophilus TaxID=376733 RepID=A0A099F1L2_9RHOB|nr:DUF1800 domain-containing protein [Paracoccus halophilus]KGJ04565.1 hypothetical protein IT41_09410 [Paracoccus halophilus]SFA50203.1 Uncharacterized conserved protein, DUF1800 family [Paracoccus halophilus]